MQQTIYLPPLTTFNCIPSLHVQDYDRQDSNCQHVTSTESSRSLTHAELAVTHPKTSFPDISIQSTKLRSNKQLEFLCLGCWWSPNRCCPSPSLPSMRFKQRLTLVSDFLKVTAGITQRETRKEQEPHTLLPRDSTTKGLSWLVKKTSSTSEDSPEPYSHKQQPDTGNKEGSQGMFLHHPPTAVQSIT